MIPSPSKSKNEFIQFLLDSKVIRFGDFTTKSGRKTPFFINTGDFKTGAQMATLSHYYSEEICQNFPNIQNLYGPAYKGIPLVAGISAAMWTLKNQNLTYTFNRKEAKDHGEGGLLVGDVYQNPTQTLVIEDVITAGTSLKETLQLLKKYPNANVQGLLVAVDRQEKMDSGKSALQEVEALFSIKVAAICNVQDIIAFLKNCDLNANQLPPHIIETMEAYREKFGA